MEKKVWKAFHQDHEIVSTIKAAIRYVAFRHQLTEHDVFELCTKDHGLGIPASILSGEQSPLEAVVMYLKIEQSLSFSEIAALLDRDDRTIWTTFNNAKRKKTNCQADCVYLIPIMLLADRKVSILEAAVEFLKEASQLSMKEISGLLSKHESTIRTAYARAKKKRGDKQ
jgi:hypothetical protein